MKKTIITLVAAATLFAAAAPAVYATNPTPGTEAARLDQIAYHKKLIKDQEEIVKKAKGDLQTAKDNIVRRDEAEKLAKANYESSLRLYEIETDETKKEDYRQKYLGDLQLWQAAKQTKDTAETNLTEAETIVSREEAYLNALKEQLKALEAVKPSDAPKAPAAPEAKKEETKAPAAAQTATGAKTLPKTSAVK